MTLENSMNNRKMISALALTTALIAGSAQAADLPYTKASPVYAPAMPPAFSWTGFYAGANVGGGFSGAGNFNSYQGTNSGNANGAVGGVQVGYNYQVSPQFVVGIENDFMASGMKTGNSSWTNVSVPFSGNNSSTGVSVPFYGTGRARAGFTMLDSQLLVYGTGGMAFGEVKDSGINKMRIGWTAGGGVEWAFRQNWSTKIEYLYTDLYKNLSKDNLPDRAQKFQTMTVGLNYHF